MDLKETVQKYLEDNSLSTSVISVGDYISLMDNGQIVIIILIEGLGVSYKLLKALSKLFTTEDIGTSTNSCKTSSSILIRNYILPT